MSQPGETLSSRVARLEEQADAALRVLVDRDRELRDIRQTVHQIRDIVDDLRADQNRRDGAIGLGKWVVGTGFLGAVGAAVLAAWHLLTRGPGA